jgi:hypothetical protein
MADGEGEGEEEEEEGGEDELEEEEEEEEEDNGAGGEEDEDEPDEAHAAELQQQQEELAAADRMACLLHAKPFLSLPAEWRPLHWLVRSLGAGLHAALHGSATRQARALAPDQFSISSSLRLDPDAQSHRTRRLVVARVDPLTGALRLLAPPYYPPKVR